MLLLSTSEAIVLYEEEFIKLSQIQGQAFKEGKVLLDHLEFLDPKEKGGVLERLVQHVMEYQADQD